MSAHEFLYSPKDPVFTFPNLLNIKTKFYSSDGKREYEKNQGKYLPYYEDVDYTFNSHGYRTVDFNSIQKPFALIHGCSHTEGVGLHEKDLYATNVCDHYGWQCVNIAKSGSSPDFNILNSMMWFNSDLPKPEIVLFQVPNVRRYSEFSVEGNIFGGRMLANHSIADTLRHDGVTGFDTILDEISIGIYDSLAVQTDIMISSLVGLWKSVGTKVLVWSWNQDMHDSLNTVKFFAPEGDERANTYGRDMMHAGAPYHECLKNFLIETIDNEC
jgi:hypothetical protein